MAVEDILLSILDLGETSTEEESVHSVVDYALHCGRMGFNRFWMGEHYGQVSVFNNPEPLIPIIASATDTISVGVAGLTWRKHCPSRIACSFSLLEKFFPGRIDLGLVIKRRVPNTQEIIDPGVIFSSLESIFQDGSVDLGVAKGSCPNLWQLTSSLESFYRCKHSANINLSKSLFHLGSNFNPEPEILYRLTERNESAGKMPARISIAIGCYVSDSTVEIERYKGFYKNIIPREVYEACIIDTTDNFAHRLSEIVNRHKIYDVVVVNLARSYQEKIQCAASIAKIFKLKCIDH